MAVLGDPGFALELARRPWPTGHRPTAAVVGRLLDDLRHQAGLDGVAPPATTVAGAAARYAEEAFVLRAAGTRESYMTWVRRLVAAHGGTDVAAIGAGRLGALVAAHTRTGLGPVGSQDGRCAEEMAVAAFRHFWAWLVAEGLTPRNVAAELRKPLRPESLRRPIRPDEAALVRQFARMSREPLLDEVAICLVERLGLRPLELGRLGVDDVDAERGALVVCGKGERRRRLPMPPGLRALLGHYLERRGPQQRTDTRLLRHADGSPVQGGWLDRLFPRLCARTPALAASGGLCLYSYRHAVASWVDPRFSRAVTRRILGHASRFTVTDQYVHAADEAVAEAICAYEVHLLGEWGQ